MKQRYFATNHKRRLVKHSCLCHIAEIKGTKKPILCACHICVCFKGLWRFRMFMALFHLFSVVLVHLTFMRLRKVSSYCFVMIKKHMHMKILSCHFELRNALHSFCLPCQADVNVLLNALKLSKFVTPGCCGHVINIWSSSTFEPKLWIPAHFSGFKKHILGAFWS